MHNLLTYIDRTALKKSYAILFLLILVIAQFGYYIYNMYQIHEAKETARLEILKQIPEQLLTKIQLQDNTGIQWEEEGREFILNNNMYDVVRIKHEGDKTYLYCYSDKNETGLLEKLESAIKENTDNSKDPKQKHLEIKITTPEWLFEVQDFYNEREVDIVSNTKRFFTHKPDLNSGYIKKIYSPPDLFI